MIKIAEQKPARCQSLRQRRVSIDLILTNNFWASWHGYCEKAIAFQILERDRMEASILS
jgi:hypothetical protein